MIALHALVTAITLAPGLSAARLTFELEAIEQD